jgi:hypothetical protein
MLGFTNWQEFSHYQWNQSAICHLPVLTHIKCRSPDFAIYYSPDNNVTCKSPKCPPIIDDTSNIGYNPGCGISEESCQSIIWGKDYKLGTRRNVTEKITFILPTMNESDVHDNMNILLTIGIVSFGGVLIVIFRIIGIFAGCNPKNY